MTTVIETNWRSAQPEMSFRCGSCTNTITIDTSAAREMGVDEAASESGVCPNCGAEYAALFMVQTVTRERVEAEEAPAEEEAAAAGDDEIGAAIS